jgi:ribosomal RNA methyltransferase Nop2
VPTASDVSSSDEDSASSSDDDDEPITRDNIAERSRKLEALAAEEAALEEEELRESAFAAAGEDDEDVDMSGEEDENGDVDVGPFRLPTAEEREAEKAKGGPDVHAVQRRMRQCARVLSRFKKRAEQGRSVFFF